MSEKNKSHLIMRGTKAVCLNCGQEREMSGWSLAVLNDVLKAFLYQHKNCQKKEAEQ